MRGTWANVSQIGACKEDFADLVISCTLQRESPHYSAIWPSKYAKAAQLCHTVASAKSRRGLNVEAHHFVKPISSSNQEANKREF